MNLVSICRDPRSRIRPSTMSPLAMVLGAALLAAAPACAPEDSAPASASTPAVFDALFTADAPDDARSVLALRTDAKDGDQVTVIGRLSDFVPGLASFRLVDQTFVPCNERPGDNCPTPWDYCCEDVTELSRGTVNVEVHEGASIVRSSLEGVHGLDHLVTVTVTGTLRVDSAENLQLVADSMHVGG